MTLYLHRIRITEAKLLNTCFKTNFHSDYTTNDITNFVGAKSIMEKPTISHYSNTQG